MSIKTRSGGWFSVLLIIAALGIWAYDHMAAFENRDSAGLPTTRRTPPPVTGPLPGTPANPQQQQGRFEIYQNCTLITARNNDGDSFLVRLHDGREVEFRLYFVDTPESDFKTYSDGDTNHDRIREQASDLDHLTPEQAVEIGKRGKSFSLELLAKRPFTIYTEWDSPFRDNRYHAHIQVKVDGKTRWLHRLLVQKGLARIKTRGADLPDGTGMQKEKETLRKLERDAKRNKAGAWAL